MLSVFSCLTHAGNTNIQPTTHDGGSVSAFCDAYAKDGATGNSDADNPQYDTKWGLSIITYVRSGAINGTNAKAVGGAINHDGIQSQAIGIHSINTDADPGEQAYGDTGVGVANNRKLGIDVVNPVLYFDVELDSMGTSGDGYVEATIDGVGFIFQWDGTNWNQYDENYVYIDQKPTYNEVFPVTTSFTWNTDDVVEIDIDSWCGLWELNAATSINDAKSDIKVYATD